MPQSDYQKMATAFLDLWQEQMARSLTDGDFLQKFMAQMQSVQNGASSYAEAFGYEPPKKERHPHPAHASGTGDDQLADLRFRLATLERKYQQLERQLRRSEDAKSTEKPEKSSKAPARRSMDRSAKPAQRKPATPVRKTAKAEPVGQKRAVKRTPVAPPVKPKSKPSARKSR